MLNGMGSSRVTRLRTNTRHTRPWRLYVVLTAWAVCSACGTQTAPVEGESPRDASVDAAGSSPVASSVAQCTDGDEFPGAPRLTELVELGTCPEETESPAGKIWQERYLDEHPDETHIVAIVLKGGGVPAPCLPGEECPAGSDWDSRARRSDQQVTCVLERATGGGDVSGLGGYWYDPPVVEAGDAIGPVGRAFRLVLSAEQVWAAASHPYVARIEPVPGAWEQWQGGEPPPAPCACPELTDDPEPKLVDLGSIEHDTSEILPLAVHLIVLPAADPRLKGSDVFASTEQSIWSYRRMFCLERALDQVIAAPRTTGAQGIVFVLGDKSFPPFGDLPFVQQAYGVNITRAEATELAKHPYVDHLELLPDGQGSHPLQPGCPPDLEAPIVEPDCTDQRESTAGKISQVLLDARADACTESFSVAVAARNGAQYCQLPECPGEPAPCPERDAWENRWHEENIASQKCVRQALEALGGTVEGESTFTNNFYTHLDWEQLEALASHPHVEIISENESPCGGGIPKP
jgi:hypothetical protein